MRLILAGMAAAVAAMLGACGSEGGCDPRRCGEYCISVCPFSYCSSGCIGGECACWSEGADIWTEDGGHGEDGDGGTDVPAEAEADAGADLDADADEGGGGPDCSTGEPITGAAAETWSWVPFPDAICGRGTATGIGINPTERSNHLLIFLLGGGGCYDAASCSPTCDPTRQFCAMFLDGFDETDLGDFLAGVRPGTIFDRSATANPFRDWDWVFVPYCTGDFHTGSRDAPYGIRHRGWDNLSAFLRRIVPTFCGADRVVLSGSSAGGFGATFNYVHVRDAFAPLRVDLVDDSGPPLSAAWMPLQTTMRAAWGSAAADPPGCADCAAGWDRWFPYLSAAYPDARLSLLSALADVSIGPGFGGPIASPPGFRTAINEFADDVIGPLPNAGVFYVDAFDHVYLKEPLGTTISVGVSLGTFLAQQVADDPAWTSVRP